MKIQIEENKHKFSITLPTNICLSKPVVKISMCLNKKTDISAEAMYAICEELRRIKKKHGSWELVDFQSADGEKINITL